MPPVAPTLNPEDAGCVTVDDVLEMAEAGTEVDGGGMVEEKEFGAMVEMGAEVDVEMGAGLEVELVVVEFKPHITGCLVKSSLISKLALLRPCPVAEVGVSSK